ncbi:Gfo/Idh/MocA family protein [Priestia endophytica]|uniref:Gfo/Idh/MocA family protein n=1 Tax=Priestia endophytica TaxID=135735 RepID=UPI000F5408DF|nr:Gfo/Idh/MocA family oxidoreductase [Priestia endophytica]RPK15195.1 hypothetical protein FH5_00630 [Priestia endophytica]
MGEFERHSTFFSGFLNSNYLREKDKHIYKKETPLYKFNIIGAGMIGHEHIKATMLEGRATVHGIYDPNQKSVKEALHMIEESFRGHVVHVYDDLKAACEDPDVDGLIICTPNYTHKEIVEEAMKSGKHILLEKPMATTLKDAWIIQQWAESYRNVFQIGLQYRYKALYQEALYEAKERNSIGNIKTMMMTEHRLPFLDKVEQWNKFSELSGGTLVEKCCHYFDLLNLFANAKPFSVYATGGNAINFKDFQYEGKKADILDHANVIIIYENGIHASFNLCMFSPLFREDLTLCGDRGRLYGYENEDFLPYHKPSTHLEVLCGESAPAKITTPCYPETIQNSGHNGGTYYEHKAFVDAIAGKETKAATPAEGFWSIAVASAADESIQSGKVVNMREFLDRHLS